MMLLASLLRLCESLVIMHYTIGTLVLDPSMLSVLHCVPLV